ncbi:unnamed protein product [Brassicogethes aeneus]|uniref:Uncharacterized protein n=1 Tax=Brassicogethes aeneus TaxID=1431903 RepID=A0A9P0BGL9_BRAAE|nr:unnamed protein product [Brassicogethes aeneus]
MEKKRKCKFSESLEKEFPFLKKGKIDGIVLCNKCNGEFSIAHGGKNDINKHLSTSKHKRALTSAASSSTMHTYFRKTAFLDEEKNLAIAEGLFAYHTINHNQSFRSMDCTSQLIRNIFNKKFTCARTKTEAIVCNVFYPYSKTKLTEEISDASYIAIFSDASNHNDVKLFPSLIRFFDPLVGIKIRLLDFISLPGETSDLICGSIFNILEQNHLKNKLIAYCADNTNSNFGGKNRKGINNVFTKLNNKLNQNIIGVGCAAHILHNAIQTAADLLSVDIENIAIKIYSYFYIYTVRVENLKEFCDSADMEYKKLLGYSKTRWLAMMPAIERILQLFSPLKSYFLTEEKCPRILSNFFEDDTSELWLQFLHNEAAVFHSAVNSIEGDNISITEVSDRIANLKLKYNERLQAGYIPLTIRNEVSRLESLGLLNRTWFMGHVRNFYKNCFDYLEQWSSQFNQTDTFSWITLRKLPPWEIIQSSLQYIISNFPQHDINENDAFDEFSFVKRYADEAKLKYWAEKETLVESKMGRNVHSFQSRGYSIQKHFSNCGICFDFAWYKRRNGTRVFEHEPAVDIRKKSNESRYRKSDFKRKN